MKTPHEIAIEVAKSLASDQADPVRLQADARQILRGIEQLGVDRLRAEIERTLTVTRALLASPVLPAHNRIMVRDLAERLQPVSRFKPLTAQAKGALQFLAARGEMTVGVANEFVRDTVSRRTAWALERRGYAERNWSGTNDDNVIYITGEGQRVADELLGELDEEAWD